MFIRAAITDDLREDRDTLTTALRSWEQLHAEHSLELCCYESAEEMLVHLPDAQIAFLDICMGGMSGIDLAKTLRRHDERVLIVFLSTSRDFAFEAFPVHPFDYLIKPYSREAIFHLMDEAMRVLASSDPSVAIRVARATHMVPLRRIVSAVAQGHTVEIHLTGGDLLRSLMSFAEAEQLLCADRRFLVPNRGVIVNMDYALSLTGDMLRMQDGSVFVLKSRNRAELSSRFTQYQLSRLKGGRS